MKGHVKKLKPKPVVDFVVPVNTADVVLLWSTLRQDPGAETLKRPNVAEVRAPIVRAQK